MTHNAARALAHDIDDGLDDIHRAAARARGRIAKHAREAAIDAVAESRELAERATAVVKARPGAALAIVAAIGAVVAVLLASRRRPR